MTLNDYLTTNKISEAAFGALIGLSQSQVNRMRSGASAPRLSIIPKIVKATNGAVTVEDFMPAEAAE